jgi:hypothetical protein
MREVVGTMSQSVDGGRMVREEESAGVITCAISNIPNVMFHGSHAITCVWASSPVQMVPAMRCTREMCNGTGALCRPQA